MWGCRLCTLSVLFFISFWAAGQAGADDFVESWYMSRGRSSLEIENYKAAIEAFEKVVERDPGNREAMRSLGVAYEKQGLKDKAIEQFDRYLARWDDDADIAFAQARALEWSRYAYREKDMLKYYRMGLKRKNDPAMRLRYATHLARHKDTSQEAVAQYDKVLDAQPRNAEAHRGLAKAYAWLGQNDLALYHANLERQQTKHESGDLTALRQDMSKGREPAVEGVMGMLAQPEKPYELYGFRMGTRGKFDITPFTTTKVEVGAEHFWNSSENRSGAYLSLGNQVRFNPSNRFDAVLEYHGAPRGDGLAYKFEYAYDGQSLSIRPGVKREFRYDSFAALAGSRASSGQLIGLARSTQFYSEVAFDVAALHVTVTPFVGWVTAEQVTWIRNYRCRFGSRTAGKSPANIFSISLTTGRIRGDYSRASGSRSQGGTSVRRCLSIKSPGWRRPIVWRTRTSSMLPPVPLSNISMRRRSQPCSASAAMCTWPIPNIFPSLGSSR